MELFKCFFRWICFLLVLMPAGPAVASPPISKNQVDSLNRKGFELRNQNTTKAYNLLLRAGELADSLHYEKGLGESYFYQAGILMQTGLEQKALTLYHKSVLHSRNANDRITTAKATQQIANSLSSDGKFGEARELLEQVLITYRQIGNINDVINVYNSLGDMLGVAQQFTAAHRMLDTAMQLSIASNYTYGEKKALYNYGLVYKQEGSHKQAKESFQKALSLNQQQRDVYGMAQCNLQLSQLFRLNEQLDSALQYALDALGQAKVLKAGALQLEAMKHVVSAYQGLDRTDQVIYWQDLMLNLRDSMSEQEKTSFVEMSELIRQQELANQANEREIEAVNSSNESQQILLAVGGGLLLVVISIATIAYLNWQRVSLARAELSTKNDIIASNATSLERLNKAIKKQNESLEEENRTKDKLLSIISHDLRHPLVNTKSILDLINLNLITDQEKDQLLEQLSSQYVHSITLLDNLLFWIRSKMQGLAIEYVPVKVFTLMQQLLEEQRMPLYQKQIMAANLVDEELTWMSERETIKIIFRNLLSNAIKFTPQGGTIRLYSERQAGWWIVHIRDSGLGMTKEVLAKVNARQYYSGRGTGNEKGSGFGLVLVRDLLARHMGELEISSEPGRGSIFSVKIPLSQTVVPEQTEVRNPAANASVSEGLSS